MSEEPRRRPQTAVESVRAWVRGHGYPLEYETARTLTRVGFRTEQGMAYEDPDVAGTMREIDVIATVPGVEPNTVGLVVECKARPKPLVVLTSRVAEAAPVDPRVFPRRTRVPSGPSTFGSSDGRCPPVMDSAL